VKSADFAGRHVAVWGAGVEGAAAVALLQSHASPASIVVVVDERRPTDPTSVHDVPVIDLRHASVPDEVTVVVKSPGISPYHGGLLALRADRPDVLVVGGTALWFAEAAAAPTQPLLRTIAVTGSKGKSTTSSLVAHLLGTLTNDVVLAGNVGRAPLDVLASGLVDGSSFPAGRWHVFELSSFQASEVAHGPAFGVLTSLFPEHLDWHLSVDRYYDDKINLFRHGHAGVGADTQVAANYGNADVVRLLHDAPFDVVPYEVGSGFCVGPNGEVGDDRGLFVGGADIPLVGAHNAANLCAALTALRIAGWEPWDHQVDLVAALKTFRPLDHRLQPVGTVGGRLVIDDSLSTAPQAAIAALAAYSDRPVGIIVGGHDRGLDYQALADALATRILQTWVVSVPESGPRIGQLISETCVAAGNTLVSVQHVDDFDEAVPLLSDLVPEGGVLLLSPAAPSFGRFRDYKERGIRFRELLGLV
jgi:UDP-N-acetylmuramoyl-L-alanine---L-glutamate ligase